VAAELRHNFPVSFAAPIDYGDGPLGLEPTMRRPLASLALAAAIALLSASGVAATGPGGWDHVGTGATSGTASLNGAVYALNADAPNALIVGGNFTSAGGNPNAARVAAWNGSAWSALGGSPISNGAVFALAYAGGKVYAGGTFLNAGGDPNADFLAVNTGAGWASFCGSGTPAFTATVDALQIIGNTLYVGGSFANAAGIASADFLAACDLTTGAVTSLFAADGDLNGGVTALTADSNGTLYAGGQFINVNGIPEADHVAAYDVVGGSWHAMGSGSGPTKGAVDSMVRSLAAHGTDVYVGTDAVDVAQIATADHVVKWNGSSWSAVGTNTAGTDGWFPASSFINSITTVGSLVFAAGSFQNANGVATADDIAYFNGSVWRPLGSNGAGNGPMIGNLTAVRLFGLSMYAGGNFTSAGGDTRAVSIAAYAVLRPDARIGLASAGPFVGNGVYSPTGVGESRTRYVTRGKTGTFYVSIQNDGLFTDSFKIKGTGGARGITVRYYRGSTNVTTAVKAGTYATGSIAPGAAITIKLVVTVSSSSASIATFLIRASASGEPSDAVKAIVKAR